MRESGIPKGFKVKHDNIPEPVKPEVTKKASPISDELRDSRTIFLRVKEVWTGHITVKPQKYVANLGSYYLVSDEGDEVYEGRNKSYQNVGLVFRNFNGKQVYVVKRGSNIWLVDGEGNKLHSGKYHEFEYLGGGEFKTGRVPKRSRTEIRFKIE